MEELKAAFERAARDFLHRSLLERGPLPSPSTGPDSQATTSSNNDLRLSPSTSRECLPTLESHGPRHGQQSSTTARSPSSQRVFSPSVPNCANEELRRVFGRSSGRKRHKDSCNSNPDSVITTALIFLLCVILGVYMLLRLDGKRLLLVLGEDSRHRIDVIFPHGTLGETKLHSRPLQRDMLSKHYQV